MTPNLRFSVSSICLAKMRTYALKKHKYDLNFTPNSVLKK